MKSHGNILRAGVSTALVLWLAACGGGNGPAAPVGAVGFGAASTVPGTTGGSAVEAESTADAPTAEGEAGATGTAGAAETTAATETTAAAGTEAAPLGSLVLDANYETGTLSSGIEGVAGTRATGADAARIVADVARSGRFAISHKVTLDDPAYVSAGSARSESDTLHGVISATHYRPGVHATYSFSLLLKDWQEWREGGAHPTDILWQFKHTNGGPDAFVGVIRNQLVLRYDPAGRITLIQDIRGLQNKWIDLKFDIYWSDTDNGWYKGWVRTEEQSDFRQAVNVENVRTYTGDPANSFGYLKWGLYRPDSRSADTGVALTREVYHDDVKVTVMPSATRTPAP